MKSEQPILFNDEMVCAILGDRKTQTRRILKDQPFDGADILGPNSYHPVKVSSDGVEFPGKEVFGVYTIDGEWGCKCPYGKPGDQLWVREAHALINDDPSHPDDFGVYYRATDSEEEISRFPNAKWKPSIFLKREYSRTQLEITNVRVERIQDISEEDALAEGITLHDLPDNLSYEEIDLLGYPMWDTSRPNATIFSLLWDSINATPKPQYGRDDDGNKVVLSYIAYPWSEESFDMMGGGHREKGTWRGKPLHVYANPWVWIVEFRQKEVA